MHFNCLLTVSSVKERHHVRKFPVWAFVHLCFWEQVDGAVEETFLCNHHQVSFALALLGSAKATGSIAFVTVCSIQHLPAFCRLHYSWMAFSRVKNHETLVQQNFKAVLYVVCAVWYHMCTTV